MSKPRCKNDSWCYTASKTSARKRVKRISNKQHRRGDKLIINEERNEIDNEEIFEYIS